MARGYRYIEEYEEDILRIKKEGKTNREIGEILGFTKNKLSISTQDTIQNNVR